MANFIEELFYGNIDPQARGYRIVKGSDSINNIEEKLTDRLYERIKTCLLISATTTPNYGRSIT